MDDHQDVTGPEVTISPYQEGDEAEILRVFKKVFDVDRTVDAWTWQYPKNPAGLHCFLATVEDRRVVSQFCGVPRRIKVRDETLCFSEIVDSLTDPDFRQGLKKPGWFAKTCYAFVDHFGRPDREVIMYGLPNPPAYRVGKRLLGYVHLYKIDLLTKSVTPAEPTIDGGEVCVVDRFSADVDDLYTRVAKEHAVMTVRDGTYLNWRYPDRPDAEYTQLEYRSSSGSLEAVVVLRHHWLDQPVTVVCEIMIERGHSLSDQIMADIEARAAAAGDERIQALFRPESPEAAGLAAFGYLPEKSQFRLVARTYDARNVDLDWLRDHWYVTLGDFDIV